MPIDHKKIKLLCVLRYSVCAVCLLIITNIASAQRKSIKYSSNPQVIKTGEALFQQNCAECHNFIQRGIGPDLSGVTTDASRAYLSSFIVNPQLVIKSGNKRSVALFNDFKALMPSHTQFKPADINALLAFINTHKKVITVIENTADIGAPIVNPIPDKISKAGLTLKLKEFATAPATSVKNPLTRIDRTVVLKGKTNRLFLLDMRGKLYEIKDKQFNVVMDMAKEKPAFMPEPGLGSGWGSFAFHPDFYKNGLLYTVHSERKNSAPADFAYADSLPVAIQWVLSEWKIKDPTASVFTGECRELLRVNNPMVNHSMQQVIFNPLAKPGSPDYGLLYVGLGDGGSAENGFLQLCSDYSQIRSSILRIDPAGKNSKNGKYGIPASNPFVNNQKALHEVYARGFRNPKCVSWGPDGRMIIADIGLSNVEEINILKAGADYGWPAREGTFLLNFKGKTNKIYALPVHDDPKYTYPVAQYDHDEGLSISGGFVYTGDIPQLKGKYIFGDIYRGRVFYVDYNDLKFGHQSIIKEFDLQFGDVKSTFVDLLKNIKADLRFGMGDDNKLYIFAKTDGKIWEVADCVPN